MTILKKIRNLFVLTFLLMLILFILGFTSHLGVAYKALSILCLTLLAAESFALFRLIHNLIAERNQAILSTRRMTLAAVGSQLQHDLRNALMVIDMTLESANIDSAENIPADLLEGSKTALLKIKSITNSLGEAAKVAQVRIEPFDILKCAEELTLAVKEQAPSKTIEYIQPQGPTKPTFTLGDSLKFLESSFQLCSTLLNRESNHQLTISVLKNKRTVSLEAKVGGPVSQEFSSALTTPLYHFGREDTELLKVWCSARTIEAMGGTIEIIAGHNHKKAKETASFLVKMTLPLASR